MNSGKARSNYLVKFATADQELLQAVEQVLAGSAHASFSDLCKQALRSLLLTPEAPASQPMLTLLEQQIMTLQLQVMHLEQRWLNSGDAELRQQVQQLSKRVNQLEHQIAIEQADPVEPEAVAADPPDDPLLLRLAPLLEDF